VQAQDAGWYRYDFSLVNYLEQCEKATKNSSASNMDRILNATTNDPAVIAHRGEYSSLLPLIRRHRYGKGLFAAENTLLAFQNAQCSGYPGVEVDLKYTDASGPEKNAAGQRISDLSSKSELILAHDENLMRFTNFGCENNFFNIEESAEIVDGKIKVNGEEKSNVVRPGSNRCSRIRNMQASKIKSSLKYMHTYNNTGHVMYQRNGELYNPIVNYINEAHSANGNSLFLRYVLGKAKNDSTLNRLIWVLDVQNYPTLELALQVVEDLNMWDRVIFKIWIEALPVKHTYYKDELILDLSRHPEANYVFGINGLNTKLINGSLMSNVWKRGELLGSEINLPTKDILNLIEQFSAQEPEHFLGFEFLIDNGKTPTDKAILGLQSSIKSWSNPGKTWGVLRVADYICNSKRFPEPCLLSKGKNLYGTAPTDGDASWVRLYTEEQATIDARWQHGLKSAVRTQDIRGKGNPAFVSPATTTAIQSQLR
ncbi:hypothetical protein, partial [Paraglaciecola sp.]|uniref:hypothetical protein n=1 Tax=Paraglaciecola sp. TaxID=1920173 RepID=UPI0030F37F72